MDLMEKVYDRARQNPQKAAFPEATEEKILRAALESGQKGYCIPLLFGKKEDIEAAARNFHLDISGLQIVDTTDEAWLSDVVARYQSYNNTLSEKACRRKARDPMYAAMMAECVGDVDYTFAGLSHTTGDVILAGTVMIGLKEGITTPSSCGIADFPEYKTSEGNLLVFGDSAVCQNPSPEDLASIAISACETASSLLGWEPRCALLSFSTDGSADGDLVDKVREAKRIANELRPDLKIDGEFQYDAAVVPEVAARKVKRPSEVAGRANVIIWPDLNVGNIGVKLIQQIGHADAYGPCLQGFRRIICDCSRGAPVSELVGNIAISGVRAAALKK